MAWRMSRGAARGALRAVTLVALAVCLGRGQTVTVADTIRTADGAVADGYAYIAWNTFTAGDGTAVVKDVLTVNFTAGVFSVQLYPNAGATPAGSYYLVSWKINGRTASTDIWVVPTGGPHAISAVRVVSAPASTLSILLSQIAPSGASSGQVPVFDGSSWLPGSIGAGSGIDCSSPATLTLDAAGAVSVTGNACFKLDTFASAAADDLVTINCTAGQRFIFQAVSPARVVTVKRVAGIASQMDFPLDSSSDTIMFVCAVANTAVELGRASN